MQVFLVPIGGDDYEPYFEAPDQPDPEEGAGETGWFGRIRRRLRDMLREAEAERHRHDGDAPSAPEGVLARWRRRVMRWIVERAAEQRLLWHLRTASAATLEAPDDLDAEAALAILKRGLKRDADRHFRWFLVHGVGLIASLALILVPGPNVVGYFLTFTTIGHLLAWRGAANGLKGVTWQVTANAVVTELRAALALASPARERRVHDVAARLGLPHLPTFFERLAAPAA